MTTPQKKNPLGPTGRTVAANIKRLRAGMPYTELAAKLEAVGRPIPTLGLRKIESEERRVDADDLVALALALGVNPNALLLPPSRDGGHLLTVTDAITMPAENVWEWGLGTAPLIDSVDEPESVPAANRWAYRRAEFKHRTDPNLQDWTKSPNIAVVESSDNGDD
jgi:hypothetical protein